MEYVIVGLLVCILVLLVILLFRKKDNSDMTERLGRFEMDIIKEMNQNFIQVNDKLEARLNKIDDRVNERINENFDKTNRTFQNVLERLSRIDEAQKKIETLSTDIVSLQSILTDKKSRGIYGEVNLKHILVNVFGEKNDKIYQLQCPLPNGTIADCVLYAPNPLGMIAIDSKFPLENYQQMVDRNLSKTDRAIHERQFKIDVKKHIDAISSKYIIPGITSDQAIMFLPAEAIFAEINAYHTDLLEYAYKKKVWITSPTTLISTLSVIQMIIKNIERDQYTSIIHEELKKLGVEFSRYKERWDHLAKSIQMVNKDVENVYITTEKITRKFDSISQVEVSKLEDKRDE